LNILGIDFEDWYHPEFIKQNIKDEKHEPIIIQGIDKILDLLRKHDTSATFFVVGELLEHSPDLLDKITENGHEIGFHTMYHTRLDTPGFEKKFLNEIEQFKHLTKGRSKGFRAPTFSLTETSSWVIDMLQENGYVYDSSVVPAKTQMYGFPNAETKPYKISSKSLEKNDESSNLIEFPLLVTKFFGKKIPAAGGFYLRTLPFNVIKKAIKDYEKKSIPASFYIHSWELTPELMPKIKIPFKNNFITYHNLDKVPNRMSELLKLFEFTSFEKYMVTKY
jgi:polysaccharide deacetylase family protein (PEP-CTERM system associated)